MSDFGVLRMDGRGRRRQHAEFGGAVGAAELPGGQSAWVIAGYDDVAGCRPIRD
jgi:hypothetical protein